METNRDYFSWSQFDIWRRSKREFWKRYDQQIQQKGNKYFSKGKELADYVETGENTQNQDLMLDFVASKLEHYDVSEAELYADFGYKKPLFCKIDSATDDFRFFVEYKTGKHPWTEDMVYKHDQLLFYATAIYLKFGFIPSAKLYWVETEEDDSGKITYTGEVKMFSRIFCEEEISAFQVQLLKTVTEIEEYNYTQDVVDFQVSVRYAQLVEEISKLQSELSLIKNAIQEDMLKNDLDFAGNALLKASLVRRKKWTYSDNYYQLEKKLKNLKAEEEKSGKATFKETKSIMIKVNKNE